MIGEKHVQIDTIKSRGEKKNNTLYDGEGAPDVDRS